MENKGTIAWSLVEKHLLNTNIFLFLYPYAHNELNEIVKVPSLSQDSDRKNAHDLKSSGNQDMNTFSVIFMLWIRHYSTEVSKIQIYKFFDCWRVDGIHVIIERLQGET